MLTGVTNRVRTDRKNFKADTMRFMVETTETVRVRIGGHAGGTPGGRL